MPRPHDAKRTRVSIVAIHLPVYVPMFIAAANLDRMDLEFNVAD